MVTTRDFSPRIIDRVGFIAESPVCSAVGPSFPEFIRLCYNDICKQFSYDTLPLKTKKIILRKLEYPSFYSSLFLYSQNLKNYYNNLKSEVSSFDNSDGLVFELIVENLTRRLLDCQKESWEFKVYEKLSDFFLSFSLEEGKIFFFKG